MAGVVVTADRVGSGSTNKEPADSGERIEYAVRYEAPEVYAGIVGHIRNRKSLAEQIAIEEARHLGGGFLCTVVQRTVIYGEWEPS